MEFNIIDINGNNKGNIELSDKVFNLKPNKHVVAEAIRHELANRRQGTVKTKTRGEVKFSTAKPWRQKGLGRARAGTRRSPIWVGGGTTFGPQPRNFSYKLPKKVKRLSIKSILSGKIKSNDFRVVDDFDIESGKTKDAFNVILGLSNIKDKIEGLSKNKVNKEIKKHKLTFIITDEDTNIKLAVKNIPWIKTLNYNRLSSHSLFYSREIICLKKAALKLNEFYL